ncbi:unnamed protein product, partial [Prorocentrum cordatum]
MALTAGILALLAFAPQVSGMLDVRHGEESCASQDLGHRAQLQNKLAGVCEAMCKEVEAYPKCNCPNFVEPDSTPGVMTWEELLSHMDQLAEWGRDSIKGRSHAQKPRGGHLCPRQLLHPRGPWSFGGQPRVASGSLALPLGSLGHRGGVLAIGGQGRCPKQSAQGWHKQAAQLQVSGVLKAKHSEESCAAQDLAQRVQLQNKLAGVCESMCKEVEAYPKCNCPNFVEPDSTPGVMTWEELLSHMDQLADWGRDSIKGWHKQASQLQVMQGNGTSTNGTKNTSAKANDACTAKVVGTAPVSLADGGMPHMVYDHVEFCGKGQLKSVAGACQHQEAFDDGPG